ncbi:inorganic triphosphatase YgiF [Rhizobium tibeticum]|uniref:CYTH and CHAD domain-containing protein n=1 Tax=Rhizobium tibeticum TaxID=501024 RepID=UPI002780E903|nr:CHAD domain-containing protein [Rhizobium tibeticum]MDP9811313.1 inorganic triphosphatase YgiF [Rhizobium tibeticum]
MSSEIEIKLELSTEALEALLGSDLLGEPEKVLEQSSTYFDTVERRLFQEGFSLRIRRSGAARMQTVKATGPSKSLFARSEWETPIDGDEPVLDHSSPLLSEFGSDLAVEPVFDVDVERRVWNVKENGSLIEVVVDQGEAVSGDRQSAIREVELELKDGDRKDLFILARKVDGIVPSRFGVRSKSEKGFALVDQQRSVFKAEGLDLERNMPAVAAFQAIASSCFRQFRLNEDVLLHRRNPEALHQARVALRRLRSAFSLFKPILSGEEPGRLNAEVRWLASVLGEARNVDVLLAKAKDADLVSKLTDARRDAYDDAIGALNSSRARALALDFNDWLQCGEYLERKDTADQSPSAEFTAEALDKMRKKLKKHGRALASVDDEHRHQVRKDAKKLRYAAEFFGSLFDSKRGARRYKKFIAAMADLQDHLGALNDLATGPDVLEKYGLADHPARDSVLSHADKDVLIGKAQDSVDDILDAKRFWG